MSSRETSNSSLWTTTVDTSASSGGEVPGLGEAVAAVWEKTIVCVANKAVNVIEICFVEFNCRKKLGFALTLPICEKALPLRDVTPKAPRLCEALKGCRAFINAESLGESERRPTSAEQVARARRCAR